ncbi:SDR family oxidoreductase [Actinomadura viridis]|uniref:NAD(P)-dependent dehydrogenase (Short-subunit alcohol dehydrogenase family) n=1 Tax=Actinomadura viridis TaxID=58110 RepID=A0A931DBG2_9ACTN|nr:SDR family oxidoreductase [Actinomadura viridis]MBG6087100.1 NAD(P)-dependent dehydrogenase (short-subunit alcohol dehydrogenase family) [Actinomadura viridis]
MGVLDGKTALVTGGSRGIGRAIALRLARDGARVAVHYGSNAAAAGETVAAIEAGGGRAFALGTELGVPGDARALWAAFDERADGLDILVNNAATGLYGRIHEVTEDDFDRAFAVNAKAPFFIIKHGLERLRDGGRIINVSSGVTRIAFPTTTAYSMTKGALEVLTHTLALELGARGITVNTVSPGIVDTEMNGWLADPAARREAEGYSTFGRVGEPADIADVVAFAASPDARWVTGQNLDATGGSCLGAALSAAG